jgi:hypothetical protein
VFQTVFETNLAPRSGLWPGRPLAVEFAARLEAAGWRVGMEELAGERVVFLYRFRRE